MTLRGSHVAEIQGGSLFEAVLMHSFANYLLIFYFHIFYDTIKQNKGLMMWDYQNHHSGQEAREITV